VKHKVGAPRLTQIPKQHFLATFWLQMASLTLFQSNCSHLEKLKSWGSTSGKKIISVSDHRITVIASSPISSMDRKWGRLRSLPCMVNLRRGTKKSDHPFQIQLQLAQRRKLPKIGEIKLDSPLGYEGNFDNHTIHGQF
jgi:hypothetical protein